MFFSEEFKTLILEIKWKSKRLQIDKKIIKKNKAELALLWIKAYYKAMVIKPVRY